MEERTREETGCVLQFNRALVKKKKKTTTVASSKVAYGKQICYIFSTGSAFPALGTGRLIRRATNRVHIIEINYAKGRTIDTRNIYSVR